MRHARPMRGVLALWSTVGVILLVVVALSFQFVGTANAEPARATPTPQSVRPFDPRTDKVAGDSTPELNLAGRPGVVLPNLCEQRAKSGGPGGQPWTVPCAPASAARSQEPHP